MSQNKLKYISNLFWKNVLLIKKIKLLQLFKYIFILSRFRKCPHAILYNVTFFIMTNQNTLHQWRKNAYFQISLKMFFILRHAWGVPC